MLNYLIGQALRVNAKRKSEDGASAVEYGLLVAAIAAIIVVIVFALGGVVDEVFNDTCTEITTEAEDIAATCGDGGTTT